MLAPEEQRRLDAGKGEAGAGKSGGWRTKVPPRRRGEAREAGSGDADAPPSDADMRGYVHVCAG
jgi:hypothetical protein